MHICKLSDIAVGAARGFRVSAEVEIFIIRRGEHIYGYYNRCPHTGAPLNWQADQFLDLSGSYIQCSGHDAMFRIEDGHCLTGPCHGQSLSPVLLTIVDEHIFCSFVADPDLGQESPL